MSAPREVTTKTTPGALHQVRDHWKGIGVTLFVNWAVKPFTMAALGWIFVRHVFSPYLPANQLDSYIAGLILLAAAPCTAMVFVWSKVMSTEKITAVVKENFDSVDWGEWHGASPTD